jgi:hypothetical protein
MDGESSNGSEEVAEDHSSEEAPQEAASPDYLILDSGTCSTCNSLDATSFSVRCFNCKQYFHALCKDEEKENSICTKSFLGQYVTRSNQSDRTGNFCFICDPCKTKLEMQQTCTTNDKVQMLDSKVSRLTQDIGDIKKLLTARAKTAVPATTEQENTTSSVVPIVDGNVWSNKEQVNRVKTLLVIDNNADCDLNNPAMMNVCNAQVHSKRLDKNGNTVVVCESPESRDALKQHLITAGVTADKITEPKPRYPTISIVGFSSEMEEADFRAKIMFKNPKLAQVCGNNNAVFDIVSIKSVKSNSSVFQAFVRVSDDVRSIIKCYGDKLFLGWDRLSVYDHHYIRRCNKCQGYNHYARQCRNTQCCGLCASANHQSLNCEHMDKSDSDKAAFYSCINCKTAGKSNHFHPAYSTECIMYRYEQTLLKKSLASESKNY